MSKSLLALISCVIISCISIKNTSKNEPIISLERTACFGKCTIYKIEIFNDGRGIYKGKKFVTKTGEHSFKITKKELNLILKRAEKINFWNMKNEYTSLISDLPTTYIKIKNKKIIDYSDAPKSLKNIENLIDSIYNANTVY